jgi:nitrite reductase (NADH) small subunit
VCAEEDVPPLEGRRVEVGGRSVAVFNTEEGFFAVGDVCPHRGGPLSDGDVAGAIVTCPLHGRKVDLETGGVTNDELPGAPTFPARVEGGCVYVDVSAPIAPGVPLLEGGAGA